MAKKTKKIEVEEVIIKDFLGKSIKVGDNIAFVQLGGTTLMKGTIISFDNKRALIALPSSSKGGAVTTQYTSQLIKF